MVWLLVLAFFASADDKEAAIKWKEFATKDECMAAAHEMIGVMRDSTFSFSAGCIELKDPKQGT